MSHHLPALPLPPGRRSTDHYISPSPLLLPNPHPPLGHYHHAPPQAQPYPPPPYRPYQPYLPPSFPSVQAYSTAPLVVSSYPHSQPPIPITYQPPPPPPAPPPRPAPQSPPSSVDSHAFHSPPTSETSSDAPVPAIPTFTPSSRLTEPSDGSLRADFSLPLPWYSIPEEPFPPKARRRRRKRRLPQLASSPLELPETRQFPGQPLSTLQSTFQPSSTITPSQTETPLTSQPPSEVDSTHPTTPSSALPHTSIPTQTTPVQPKSTPRPIVPAIPLFPDTSNSLPRQRSGTLSSTISRQETAQPQPTSTQEIADEGTEPSVTGEALAQTSEANTDPTPPPIPKAQPKSWADLVRAHVPKDKSAGGPTSAGNKAHVNGVVNGGTGSLIEALLSFNAESDEASGRKISFLEPRGLVNTGNMCYMNSVLQILIFCTPFNEFLGAVGRRSKFSFKDATPLLDALILFLREFRVIDTASSPEQLKLRLKESELEEYGEAFIPDFVYDVIRRLPRFSSMRRGHQQDAEEFLGFLLEGLHEECVQVMKGGHAHDTEPGAAVIINGPTSNGGSSPDLVAPLEARADEGWHEVGPRQKVAVTRSSGAITTESPITKIFGGKLRSELRVPGLKPSVTLEPYQPLQLDIQSPHVNNIIDALKGLTRSETLHGNFSSPRGPGATATKQVFIETLPQVLILHLKRFHYDNAGGTQKIWKKVGFPLDLEIPKEAFPIHKRGPRFVQERRYRLIGVVYHHGKNASGGHYTVDVRRQEGYEWIRLDDTVIRRIRSTEVAEGGSDEDAGASTSVWEQHQSDTSGNGNVFYQMDAEDSGLDRAEEGWKQVNGNSGANGTPGQAARSDVKDPAHLKQSDRASPSGNQSISDNKVAYLLFYQKV